MKGKLTLFNTLGNRYESFESIRDGGVGIYVCGPTVNGVPHLGHARQQITFDILRKYLRHLGYNVKFVSNITDGDDKIIAAAQLASEDLGRFTEKNLAAHTEDYARIGVEAPDFQPRATQHIGGMVNLVGRLKDNGFAYIIPGDGVYYDVSKFTNYGALSGQDTSALLAGTRKAANDRKRNFADFVLWKFSKPGEPEWDSPWGKGRPGWHIECSTMSAEFLGLPFDIHCGGQDLIFPHHEDEIAQSEAAYGVKIANYWIHNGLVNVDNVKMSKSFGNFRTIRDLLLDYSGEAIRYFVLSSHYRKPVNFSRASLDDARNSIERLRGLASSIEEEDIVNTNYLAEFEGAMSYDLNTPRALSVVWHVAKDNQAKGRTKVLKIMDKVLGLGLFGSNAFDISDEIKKLAVERTVARKQRYLKRADKLRELLNGMGWQINDTSCGYKLKKI